MSAGAEPVSSTPIPEVQSQRADLFRLLARLFYRAVDRDVLRELADSGFLSEVIDDPRLLDRLGGPDSATLEELAVAHTALFCGPAGHVPPYASCHHPAERKGRRLWGDATVWFRRFALDHGLRFEGSAYDGIPDHVAFELEVYARLLDAAARAAADAQRIARLRVSMVALVEHMGQWVPPFCSAARSRAGELPSPVGRKLYGALLELAEALLRDESDRLAAAADERAG